MLNMSNRLRDLLGQLNFYTAICFPHIVIFGLLGREEARSIGCNERKGGREERSDYSCEEINVGCVHVGNPGSAGCVLCMN